MKKTFKIILSYLLITFNSNVFSVENNQANILKIGVLAPFPGEFKELGQTILYSVNLALHDINDDSIKIYPKDSGYDKKRVVEACKEFQEEGIKIIIGPGLIIVKECIKKKIDIFPIPGVSAVSTAMSVSGFDDQYFFYGFLRKKSSLIEKEINKIKDYDVNIVFFVPAVKINFYIKYFKKFFKGRNIFIGREMTKIHETFYRENLDKFSGFKENLKGELTVVLSKKINNFPKKNFFDETKLRKDIGAYLKRYSLKDVVKLVSEKNNLSKKKVYNICLSIKKK